MLDTGRTHQIRVHLAAIGHPVCGDPPVRDTPGSYGLERQFLHAARLAFPHPVTGAEVDVRSPLPADLAAALARAERGDQASGPCGQTRGLVEARSRVRTYDRTAAPESAFARGKAESAATTHAIALTCADA